jgi:hypothetical protein
MEPLQLLFRHAHSTGVLSHLHANCDRFRMSVYADDAPVFINPAPQDVEATRMILKIFGEASGLTTNLVKTEFLPIRCQQINVEHLFGMDSRINAFPCVYLGLPLHYKKLPKMALQPLIQKVGRRLPGWKRNLLSYPGRELLVKSVLSSMPTHFLTMYEMPKWAIKEIDMYRRSFFWCGEDSDKVHGGHCLVNWATCTRPKKWGGRGAWASRIWRNLGALLD